MTYNGGRTHPEMNGRKLVVAQSWARLFPDAQPIPNMIDIFDEDFMPHQEDGPINIFYGYASEHPSRWRRKGSTQVIPILNRVQQEYEGKVKIHIIRERPYKDVLEVKKKCHIVIGDCVTGGYHLTELEGASVGAVTFCFIDNTTLRAMQTFSKADGHPFIKTHVTQLYVNLKRYIENQETREQIQKKARTWMEQYWNPKDMVQHYIKKYEEVLHK